MCTIIRDHLRKDKDLSNLRIEKYTSEDEFEVLLNSHIIVSTLGSAGTAVDIPNLITVINTVLVSSSKTNVQALGRLRKLKDKKVRFIYIYARNHDKHRKYHYDRLNQYRDRVSFIRMYDFQKDI